MNQEDVLNPPEDAICPKCGNLPECCICNVNQTTICPKCGNLPDCCICNVNQTTADPCACGRGDGCCRLTGENCECRCGGHHENSASDDSENERCEGDAYEGACCYLAGGKVVCGD